MKVLIVEDDHDVGRSLEQLLSLDGLCCTWVTTASEAQERLNAGEWDLLITDLNMPDHHDLTLLEHRIPGREMPPIIVITGYPTLQTALRSLRVGVFDYVVKPFDPAAMIARVRAAIARGQEQAKLARLRELAVELARDDESMHRAAPIEGLPQLPDLSARELEVVAHLSNGLRVPQIAQKMGISIHTVRNHLASVYRKLDVHSQTELVARIKGLSFA